VYFSYRRKPGVKATAPIAALFPSGCLTCGQKNVSVQYHGERHLCFKCRRYLQTPHGKPVVLITTPDSQRIMAFFKRINIDYIEG
jgi:hypothetical protein